MTFDALEVDFAPQAEMIANLRSDDTRFAEICTDYELLLRDYRRISNVATTGNSSTLSDIQESLTDLREEIAIALTKGAARDGR